MALPFPPSSFTFVRSRRASVLSIVLVLALSVAGCGSQTASRSDEKAASEPMGEPAGRSPDGAEDGASDTGSPSPSQANGADGDGSSTAAPGDGFCDAVAGVGDDLALVDLTADWEDDPKRFVTQVSVAAERFSTVAPPAPIARSWEGLGDFFSMVDGALAGVEVEGAEDLIEALRFEGEDAFAMVVLLPGHAETVGAFVQDECGVDLGIEDPVVANVCELLDGVDIDAIFAGSAPGGEHRRWGEGVVECVWDDRDGIEVGVVIGPAESVRSDLLQDQEAIEVVEVDAGAIEVFDGAIGPMRMASGRTAALDSSDTAGTAAAGTTVMASVRGGDVDGDAAAAVDLVETAIARLP